MGSRTGQAATSDQPMSACRAGPAPSPSRRRPTSRRRATGGLPFGSNSPRPIFRRSTPIPVGRTPMPAACMPIPVGRMRARRKSARAGRNPTPMDCPSIPTVRTLTAVGRASISTGGAPFRRCGARTQAGRALILKREAPIFTRGASIPMRARVNTRRREITWPTPVTMDLARTTPGQALLIRGMRVTTSRVRVRQTWAGRARPARAMDARLAGIHRGRLK
jgi:hypothetical protein